MNKVSTLCLLMVSVTVVLSMTPTLHVKAYAEGELLWSQTGKEFLYTHGVAVDSSGLYIVGSKLLGDYFYQNFEWVVEKRNITDGSLIWNRTAHGDANSVVVDGSGLYVAGANWRIEKRDPMDGALLWFQTGTSEYARGIAADSSAIYVVGYEQSGLVDLSWRIEKRSLDSGLLLWYQTSLPFSGSNSAYDVTVDRTGVYIVGE